MSLGSLAIRSTHLLTNAAWFGGTLMGAVGVNRAAQVPDDSVEAARVAGAGWESWGPVQGAAIALHLLSGVGILADNRRRVAVHGPTRGAVVAKTALTAAALTTTGLAWYFGEEVGDIQGHEAPPQADAGEKLATARQQLAWLQWATPALTGGLLVLDAYLGEQQRGWAGLLDRR